MWWERSSVIRWCLNYYYLYHCTIQSPSDGQHSADTRIGYGAAMRIWPSDKWPFVRGFVARFFHRTYSFCGWTWLPARRRASSNQRRPVSCRSQLAVQPAFPSGSGSFLSWFNASLAVFVYLYVQIFFFFYLLVIMIYFIDWSFNLYHIDLAICCNSYNIFCVTYFFSVLLLFC